MFSSKSLQKLLPLFICSEFSTDSKVTLWQVVSPLFTQLSMPDVKHAFLPTVVEGVKGV